MKRRDFLQAFVGAAIAPALVRAAAGSQRFPIAFSTLGCPRWDWKTILEHAAEWGYAAIELRGIQDDIDLTKRPEFSPGRLAASLKDLEALELRISDLGASAHLHETDAVKRAAQLDEGKRYIDLAHQLHAPYVRVFGDKVIQPKEATVKRVIEGLQALGEHAKGSGVSVIMESHGDFTDSPTLLEVLRGVNMPNVALLWDAYHTFVSGHEQPADTFRQLGGYIRHTHLKDSKPGDKGARYVLTGEGTVPVRDTVRVLVSGGYRGYYCFEWEKRWHPEIDEPEIAFPHYAKVMREYLKEAGYKARE